MDGIRYEKIIIKKETQHDLVGIVKDIACKANQNPGEEGVLMWLSYSDYLLLAKNQEENVVGFMLYAFWKKKIIYIVSAMILPEYQQRGILKILTKRIISSCLVRRFFCDFFNVLSPVYLFFKTQNPRVYAALYKKVELYPSIGDNVSFSPQILEYIREQIKKHWPKAIFDEEKFILKNVLINQPFLAYDPQDVPWSIYSEVNNLFIKNLNFKEKKSMHDQVVLAKFNIKKLFFSRK